MTKKLDICLSPAQLSLFDLKGKVVVIIDVLRATSTINTALANGVKEVIPVSTIEEGLEYKAKGYIVGAERDGKKHEGFSYGNSPYEYMTEEVKGQSVVLTTSNGTKALKMSHNADEIITASFLNANAVIEYLKMQDRDIILFCSGWKDRFSLEDTLCAGALANGLKDDTETSADSTFAAVHLYTSHADNLFEALQKSAHFHRLSHNGMLKDIEYCVQENTYETIPVWNGKALTLMPVLSTSN
jgi:2-phosphosulfolactate phosphatase